MTPSVPGGQTPDSVAIRFESDGGTLDIVDAIERRRYSLSLSRADTPTPIGTESFLFPVDEAVAVRTDGITVPTVIAVYVRNADGRMLAEVDRSESRTFPPGSYVLELCAPMKLYVRIEGAFEIDAGTRRMAIDLPERTDVSIGARSKHDRPAATITTTDDPKDVMAAISTFGSALKTTSPERSYPTLRGHPPTIERGERLTIPEGISAPETGITIEVPRTLSHAYVVAPLAYYLGATVEPATRARIRTNGTNGGPPYPLAADDGFEREVERALKRTFFLDCITRTEGIYPIDLHERRSVERAVGLDFRALYDRSIADRLEAYLSVPHAAIEPYVPDWKLTSHVSPTPSSIEMLPFLANDLAVVRTPDPQGISATRAETTAVEGFLRGTDGGTTREATADTTYRPKSYVEPTATDSLEQTWVGSETPMGASKAMPQAYRNRLARERSSGDISITVVCNDPGMGEERDVVDDVYGSREELPFEVALNHDLTRNELADVLETDSDFLHYIGHIEPGGFECPDGLLDATTVESIGVDSFLLNGCRSYDQGMALIDGGAIGGIVTLADVINAGAVSMGSTLARLLNTGFPLRAALEVAKGEDVVGEQYIVIGDGGLTIAQPESGTAVLSEIEPDGDGYAVDITTYATSIEGMGSLMFPVLGANEKYYLNSGELERFHCSADELREFLRTETMPVRLTGDLHWSDELSVEEI